MMSVLDLSERLVAAIEGAVVKVRVNVVDIFEARVYTNRGKTQKK